MTASHFPRLFLIASLAFGALTSPALLAQDYQADAKAKLEASVQELATIRGKISQEKLPLASELRELENKVLGLRRERERMQRIVDNQSVDLSSLTNQVKAYDDEAGYAANLLNDYLNRVNASLTVGEVKQYGPAILGAMNKADVTGLPLREKISFQLQGVELAINRTLENVGGVRFPGEAVLPGGKVAKGTYAQLGPVSYFAADSTNAGIVMRGASETPSLIVFDPKAAPAIQSFVSDGKGALPIDPTMGRALALASADETLSEHFLKGGLWMWPIAFFGVLALVVALFKLVEILGVKSMPRATYDQIMALVKEGKTPEAITLAKKYDTPDATMVVTGLQNLHLSKELMEEFLFETLLTVKPKLERGSTYIGLAASVAPLLGLLGTVTGMIETFKLLTLFGTGDAKSLSSGISEALITTEYGLIVAIPACILGAIVNRMISVKMSRLEGLMISFANSIAEIKETTLARVA